MSLAEFAKNPPPCSLIATPTLLQCRGLSKCWASTGTRNSTLGRVATALPCPNGIQTFLRHRHGDVRKLLPLEQSLRERRASLGHPCWSYVVAGVHAPSRSCSNHSPSCYFHPVESIILRAGARASRDHNKSNQADRVIQSHKVMACVVSCVRLLPTCCGWRSVQVLCPGFAPRGLRSMF